MAGFGAYPVGVATLNLRQSIFTDARKSWNEVLDKFNDALESVSSEGEAASQQRHQSRGQLLARDRLALLLDHDSPFLEIAQFAGFGLDSTPCASLIAGIGKVSGKACMILCHIPSIKGGAWNEYTILKHNRATEIATENDLPIIGLAQAAGAYLPQQFRVFHRAGQMFRDLARRSQKGIPACSVVFGSSTAGGAYLPGMSDYTIFVRNQAQVFLGGPPLVKMAIGEEIDAETLGGADMHATITGLADQIAMDEFDAIRKAREWMWSLQPPTPSMMLPHTPLPPRYPAEDLLSLVNPDIRKPFDMGEVVLRLVDDSRVAVFKPNYGKNLLTCSAEIHGYPVGIIGNQTPVIHPDEACKGAQFIRMCNQKNIPIVYLHNVTGFMVGSRSEKDGIIKKGAQFVSAVACSKVPQISIILGSSYGAGNYAMCGRAYQPRFLFTWPSGRCSVMGPDQLAGVMDIVQTGSAARKEKEGIKVSKKAPASVGANKTRDMVERESQAYYTSAHLLDDGIIDPRDTRDILGICLDVVNIPKVEGADSHQGLARL
ncbi:propionyl-CoA carboxylase beta chain [Ilyonectria destructans]|nr:propionyl-CoA carboxylase beta chain [Ilyonectria destructans]